MAAPNISNFGDENHEEGETGLVVDGFSFGFDPGDDSMAGELWMYQNSNRSGNADQLTVGAGGWSDMQLTGVAIPGAPNNAAGAVFLFVKRFGDNAWSLGYAFTLSAAGSPAAAPNCGIGLNLDIAIGL